MMQLRGNAFRLFSLGRTPVYVHGSFGFLVLIYALQIFSSGAPNPLGALLAWCLAVFVSLMIHEFGHVFAAKTNGHGSSVMLWGMGGVTMPDGPSTGWRGIWMSFAGPLFGFVAWGIFWFLLMPSEMAVFSEIIGHSPKFEPRLIMQPQILSNSLGEESSLYHSFWADLCWINLWWGFLNLLPVSPLDGGHILEHFVRFKKRAHETARIVSIVGLVVAGGVAAYGLMNGWTFLGIIMAMLAYQNWQRFSSTQY